MLVWSTGGAATLGQWSLVGRRPARTPVRRPLRGIEVFAVDTEGDDESMSFMASILRARRAPAPRKVP